MEGGPLLTESVSGKMVEDMVLSDTNNAKSVLENQERDNFSPRLKLSSDDGISVKEAGKQVVVEDNGCVLPTDGMFTSATHLGPLPSTCLLNEIQKCALSDKNNVSLQMESFTWSREWQDRAWFDDGPSG